MCLCLWNPQYGIHTVDSFRHQILLKSYTISNLEYIPTFMPVQVLHICIMSPIYIIRFWTIRNTKYTVYLMSSILYYKEIKYFVSHCSTVTVRNSFNVFVSYIWFVSANFYITDNVYLFDLLSEIITQLKKNYFSLKKNLNLKKSRPGPRPLLFKLDFNEILFPR